MLPLHDRLEAPDPVTLVGVSAQARPVDGLVFSVSPTKPLNPCWAVNVIVDVPTCPASGETDTGLAAMAKSCTV